MRKLSLVTLLCFSFCLSPLFGQSNYSPGYIITHEFDTIHGIINSRGEIKNSKECSFKTDKSSNVTTYKAGDIFGYRILDGKLYISKEVTLIEEPEILFLEVLLDGIVDLYYCRDKQGTHFYLEKVGTRLMELTNELKLFVTDKDTMNLHGGKVLERGSKRYIGVLRAIMIDSDEIQREIETTEFTQASLIDISEKYHNYVCEEGEECVIYYKELPKTIFKFGIYASAQSTKNLYKAKEEGLGSNPYTGFVNKSGVYPTLGLHLEIVSPRLNENIAFQMKLGFGKTSYSSDYTETGTISYYEHEMQKDITFGSVHLIANYNFSRARVRPFVGLGFGTQILIKEEGTKISEYYQNDVLVNTEETPIPNSSPYLLLKAQTGLNADLYKSLTLFLNISFELGFSTARLDDAWYANQTFNTIGISTGFLF